MTLLDTQVLWFANLPPVYMLDETGDLILGEDGEPIIDEAWTGGEWTLDGSQLNELDTGGILDGDVAVDLTDLVAAAGITISRGRNDQFSDISPGSATIVFDDIDRRFDSTYTAGPYYGQLVPGKKVQIITDGVIRMEGTVRSWRHTYRSNAPSTVTLTIEDALARLGRRKFLQWTTTAGSPRQRLVDVLQRNEVAYTAPVDLDDGVFTLQGDNVSYGSSVLNYMQLVARSDLGRLFAARDNTLTFRDRLSATGTPVLVFADDGTGVDFDQVNRSDDARTLYTRATVDRVGGIAQTSVNDQAELDYDGARAYSLTGLLLNSDTDSADLADYLTGILSTPEQRIESVAVKVPNVEPAVLADTLAVDLADVVQVLWTPLGIGAPLDLVCVVESMNEKITWNDHVITFGLSTVANRSPWTLEDDLLGALDSVAVLAF